MDVINARTELYDLFGETAFCAVCQEDVQEGERIRAIQDCHHAFHSACVDPWLLKKGTCPVCRASLQGPSTTDIVSNIYRVSHRLRSIIQSNPDFSIDDFLSQIETVVLNSQQATVETPEMVLRRYTLGYCLAEGILRKFRTAAPFRENGAIIRTTLANFQHETVRPYPLDSSTRAALKRSKNLMRDEVIRRLSWEGNIRMFNTLPTISSLLHRMSLIGGNLSAVWIN